MEKNNCPENTICIEEKISELVEYAVRKKWLDDTDRIWAANRILEALQMDGFGGIVPVEGELPPVQEILDHLCDYAYEHGVTEGNSAAYYDLLDTRLMGLLLPRPSEIARQFSCRYEISPQSATDWYYEFSGDTNYIRRDRISKDRKWTVDTEYGSLDITINLSKPEKDPKAIAAAGKAKSAGYPKCLLCTENEGYAGHLNHPARQNHRIIPIELGGRDFFLQYSPYVYYNEHCIVFNKEHIPMHIDRQAFTNLLNFVTVFPHYFIGSNADLPIVGGSVLSHDHYQGGNYEFAMARAEIEEYFEVPGFPDVEAGILKWPMSVIRICSSDKERVIDLADHILAKWRSYDDPEVYIFHKTCDTKTCDTKTCDTKTCDTKTADTKTCDTKTGDKTDENNVEQHSTITPIARRRGDAYELDLVLRNNITTEDNPLGVFHPHAEKHHIKKENIGLIEVMGLAVLPARLKDELAAVEKGLLEGCDLASDPLTASHAEWAMQIKADHPELNADNARLIIRNEVGKVFAGVLKDAGVFKRTEEGKAAFMRFIRNL